MIAEDYVSFEIAKLLKEKGFDESTLQRYDTDGDMSSDGRTGKYNSLTKFNFIAAPTLQMVMKWLREVYHIFIRAIQSHIEYCSCEIYYNRVNCYEFRESFNSYEEACEAAIKYCLENLI